MSFISSAMPLLNGMKMKETIRMKHVLSALTLSAVLASPAWAVYHKYALSAATILENGKILYSAIGLGPNLFAPESFTDHNEVGVAYDGDVYVCHIFFHYAAEKTETICYVSQDLGVKDIHVNE